MIDLIRVSIATWIVTTSAIIRIGIRISSPSASIPADPSGWTSWHPAAKLTWRTSSSFKTSPEFKKYKYIFKKLRGKLTKFEKLDLGYFAIHPLQLGRIAREDCQVRFQHRHARYADRHLQRRYSICHHGHPDRKGSTGSQRQRPR